MFHLLLLIALAVSMNVKDCSGGTGSMSVTTIDLNPDPPVHGVNCTATANFRVTKPIDTLKCQLTVKKSIIPIYRMDLDFCEALTCPLSPGPYNKSMSVPIPSYAPTGDYGLEIHCKDKAGAENVCAQADITIA